MVLLDKFKAIWEDGLYDKPELIKEAGISQYELAFLGGYIYYAYRVVTP